LSKKKTWFHKLSTLDYRDVGEVSNAFKMVYDFYVPEDASVLDMCCGKKIMYGDNKYPNVTFNDLRTEIDADHHYDCRTISKNLNRRFEWFIYDPPYVDIQSRQDEREDDYGYNMVSDIEEFEQFTYDAKREILKLMQYSKDFYRNGIIAKITDFHWDDRIRGHHDWIKWFEPEFYLYDLRIYRFYRRAVNINWYKRKCFKSHSYFLIFKPSLFKKQ